MYDTYFFNLDVIVLGNALYFLILTAHIKGTYIYRVIQYQCMYVCMLM